MIMERYNADVVRVFDMLRQLSQDMNLRLAEIAQRVVDIRGDYCRVIL